ncbi:MAG: phosphate ABC transporter permease PstA [Desulfovibrio sp.]|nr:phosphate ABC transporter permease PstA [Desulfovibrio sp.]MCA1984940.1 phosphate ABC transporter permease PstA [Desulfovibrio sp.]
MSVFQTDQSLKAATRRRLAFEKYFQWCTRIAIALAAGFLVYFLFTIGGMALPAFRQGQLLVEISYTEDVLEMPNYAVPEEYEFFVSHEFLRQLPLRMQEHPELLGTTAQEWVLAAADVDQLLKGKAHRLDAEQVRLVQELAATGHTRLAPNWDFFTKGDSKIPEAAGIEAAVVGTVYVLVITLLLSFPVGVASAIYLEEFAPDNRLTQLIEVNINNLAAIPSIIYGLLGLAIFINLLGILRSSSLVGGITLALMTLPVIIISTRAAIRAVPETLRHGALALGATPWQVMWNLVLPLAMPGILTGTIIGLAHAIGETAPLLIVGMMAYIPEAPSSVLEASTVLPAQIYTWASDSQRAFGERTAAGILVLLVVLLSMNALAIYLRNRFEKRW